MLTSFRVANFRGIRDPLELSLQRWRPDDPDRYASWPKPDISPVVAIYGANASGKTTVLDAIDFAVDAVRDSFAAWAPASGVPVAQPFAFDASRDAPTEFEVEFSIFGTDYQYGFAASSSEIVYEQLSEFRSARPTRLYERRQQVVEWGDAFRGEKASIARAIAHRGNALVLSAGAQLGSQSLATVHHWLTNAIWTYDSALYEAEHELIAQQIDEDEAFHRQLCDLLGSADVGITGIETTRQAIPADVMQQLEGSELGRQFRDRIDLGLQLRHKTSDGSMTLPFHRESRGTRALLSFGSVVLMALSSGRTIVIDELDSSLHPVLVAELVRMFQDPTVNRQQAQLVFTTHDISLMGGEAPIAALERDQIWLTQKARDGSVSLSSVADFKPRQRDNLARAYTHDRFGGLPHPSFHAYFAAGAEGEPA